MLQLHGEEHEWKVTNKWSGYLVRRKLHLRTERSREGYVIPGAERDKLERLFEKYGLMNAPATEMGADGDREPPSGSVEPTVTHPLPEVHNVHKFTEC